MPNCVALTFEVVRMVSFRFCPVRPISLCQVVTLVCARQVKTLRPHRITSDEVKKRTLHLWARTAESGSAFRMAVANLVKAILLSALGASQEHLACPCSMLQLLLSHERISDRASTFVGLQTNHLPNPPGRHRPGEFTRQQR